ncbi:superinfection immunity protein [Trinickia sp. NRRL B-1857]|uniref:superinfection immunity protein n=1 Tax=Trinickia sp. NRRL B-1857 TaxID=3162879 RepID=UPI003D2B44A0
MLDRIALQVVEVVFALAIYFCRRSSRTIANARRADARLFNACLGWTVLGWLLALYWAHLPNPPQAWRAKSGQAQAAADDGVFERANGADRPAGN